MEQKTRTKTEILIFLSPSVFHRPFYSSLFMKHTHETRTEDTGGNTKNWYTTEQQERLIAEAEVT